jgi:hypothetical protein
MKRLLLLGFLFFYFGNSSFANDESNITNNFGVSFLFPLNRNENIGNNILGSLLLSSVSGGLGYHLNIVQGIFSPGIYGDVHVSLLSLLTLFSSRDEDKENSEDYGKRGFLFIQVGIRLYNQFKFGLFDIQPFIGLNLLLSDELGFLKAFGVLLAYKNFGIEYSLLFDHRNSIANSIHRIVFVYHIR